MVHLFLSEPNWNEYCDCGPARQIIPLLNRLESVIRSLVTSGGRSEARQWLRSMVSSINFITPRQQREIFVSLLRSKPRKPELASQLLQMIFQKTPQKLGAILAKRSHILEKFFDEHPKSILQWFSGFADDGGSDHKRGAKAFAQFAFLNRDICWDELEWKGKHGQSPAVVASKPHYFLDLDIRRTIENFIDNVPEFWSSDEFAQSLQDGQILFLDNQFFIDFFVDLMYKEDSRSVWKVIDEFLLEESFFSLSQHLLITLGDQDLSCFLKSLSDFVDPKLEPKDLGSSISWFQVILLQYGNSKSIDELLLLNAVINQGRQLLWLVRDDDANNELQDIKDLMLEVFKTMDNTSNLLSFFKECFKMKARDTIKFLGLLAWVIHYGLSEECHSPESWESLFTENGIDFRKSQKHSLLQYDLMLAEGSEPEFEGKAFKTRRHKKSKKGERRKKRKRSFHQDLSDDEPLDISISNQGMGIRHGSESWLLSTDGFSATWTIVDLPEYVAKHCLSTWMKWFVARSDGA